MPRKWGNRSKSGPSKQKGPAASKAYLVQQ
jgi:hypothetical protein